jgi:hypothetical protein
VVKRDNMTGMRALLPALLVCLCGACAPAPPSIVGSYARDRVNARDDPDWRGLVGEWRAEYRSDGHLIVHGANGLDVDSRYRLDGDVLTLTDLGGSASCRDEGVDYASGRYRIRLSGDQLRFEVLRDECTGRRSVITSHPLRRLR